MYARYRLVSRKHEASEIITDYLHILKELVKNCTFEVVNANDYREQLIWDSFIKGLTSPFIRNRLLENDDLTLTRAFDLPETLHHAQRQSTSIGALSSQPQICAARLSKEKTADSYLEEPTAITWCSNEGAMPLKGIRCYFCGGPRHSSNK